MHEIELEQGLQTQRRDQRGIERLRLLALRMQNMPLAQESKVSVDMYLALRGVSPALTLGS
jgi:hypothetical protein